MNREQLQAAIFEKSLSDAAFRAALAADPIGAIGRAFDIQFAPGTKVRVHVESVNELHFVVPEAGGGALADSALDAVAGGIRAVIGGAATSGGTQSNSFVPQGFTGGMAPIQPGGGC